MILQLSVEERHILKHLLQREIGETGPEIRHTNTSTFRDELKDYKRSLQELYRRILEQGPPHDAPA